MANDTIFCNGFVFRIYKFKNYRFTDSMDGTAVNYLAYMIKGNARLVSEDEVVSVSEGDIFFIPSGSKYRSYWYGKPEIEFISLSFSFLPNFENRLYKNQVLPKDTEAIRVMYEIASDTGETPTGVGKLYSLLGALMPKLTYRLGGKGRQLINKATEMMSKEPKITVKEIAKRCAVSESTLYSAFKKHSEKSLGEVRSEILMKSAKDILISTDLPIEEIAEKLSFSSGAYFRKCFKDYFGISPREMRKNHSLL